MRKFLIVTDSHWQMAYSAIDLVTSLPPINALLSGTEFDLIEENMVHGNQVDILGLCARTAYNFANHLDLIKDKDYDDYTVLLFMGFNDLIPIYIHKNPEAVVKQYIDSAIARFGRSNIKIITPLKHLDHVASVPESLHTYHNFIHLLKQYCQRLEIDYYDINQIIGPTSKKDLVDEHHLNPRRFLKLYYHLGIVLRDQ